MGRRIFTRDERGNVAVEFALVLPIFLMILMGIVDYGLAARQKSTMEAAARVGLQVLLNDADDTDDAEIAAEDILGEAGGTVSVDSACLCDDGSEVACDVICATGNRRRVVTVNVSKQHSLLVPWPGLSDPLTLTAMARVRVQ